MDEHLRPRAGEKTPEREETSTGAGASPEGRSPGGAESLGLRSSAPGGEGLQLEQAGGKRILYGGNPASAAKARSRKGRRLVDPGGRPRPCAHR